MPFYHYYQNNSFGKFIGPRSVVIEADDHTEANTIAEANGLYFDGVAKDGESDCPCCGDRWHRKTQLDGGDEVAKYFQRVIADHMGLIPEDILIVTKEKTNG